MKKLLKLGAIALAAVGAFASGASSAATDDASGVNIVYDANGGKIGKVAKVSLALEYDEETEAYVYVFPDNPVKNGMTFDGWWTAKTDGVEVFDNAVYGEETSATTLYAHWIKPMSFTLKGLANIEVAAVAYDPEARVEETDLEKAGKMNLLPGEVVQVSASEGFYDERKDVYYEFQKWLVTPAAADLGADFAVNAYETSFTMPNAAVTIAPVYVEEEYAYLSSEAEARSLYLGGGGGSCGPEDEADGDIIQPEAEYKLQWSYDGGKSWYPYGAQAKVKPGTYTVQWRSLDPRWAAPKTKEKVQAVYAWEYYTAGSSEYYTFVPEVECEILCDDGDGYEASSACGTVTINPKDGLVQPGKTMTLGAKANKNYVFQGWAVDFPDEDEDEADGVSFKETATTFKKVNEDFGSGEVLLNNWVQADGKVHVKAYFKALSAYKVEDIALKALYGYDSDIYPGEDGSVTISGFVGCSLDEYELSFDMAGYPLAYKIEGKLPAGIKFNAKKGLFTGAPTKAGDTTVALVVTDPAKHVARIAVNFAIAELPDFLVGNFRGVLTGIGGSINCDDEGCYISGDQASACGIVEFSVTANGKGSAKVFYQGGTASYSGQIKFVPDAADDEDCDDCVLEYGDTEDSSSQYGGTFYFDPKENKNDWMWLRISEDGSLEGSFGGSIVDGYLDASIAGVRQDASLLASSGFLDKYYTAKIEMASSSSTDDEYCDECGDYSNYSAPAISGYGYLTLKTDKKGAIKIAGKLPDGQAVSQNALLVPYETEEGVAADVYVFSAPSAYKKQGWFCAVLTISPDGTVAASNGTFARLSDDGYETETYAATVGGAYYSPAVTLDNYYYVSCASSESVVLPYTVKSDGETYTDYAYAESFSGYYFNVELAGDKSGGIKLAGKSPKPWKDKSGEYNYNEDAKGNWISDPSQLTISYTKATGLFSGKATVYFDYEDTRMQHKEGKLDYAGVVVNNEDTALTGYGAALYKYKDGKVANVVSLPVVLDSGCEECSIEAD